MTFSEVKGPSIDYVWTRVYPMVLRACKHGAGDAAKPEHLLIGVKSGKMMMWAVHEDGEIIGALVLSDYQYPAKRTIFIELLAGNFGARWDEALQKAEELFRDYKELVGADTIEAVCRDGLTRRLKRWRRKATLLELN